MEILLHTMHYAIVMRGMQYAFATFAFTTDAHALMHHLRWIHEGTDCVYDLVSLDTGLVLMSTDDLPNKE